MYKSIFFSSCLFLQAVAFADTGVTYDFSGGRFGDNVLSYLHAKWIAREANLPLIYKPFNYSNELKMDDLEDGGILRFTKTVSLNKNHPFPLNEDNTLFVCPYFPEVQWELNRQEYFTFPVGWKDESFRKDVLEKISPKQPLTLTYPPENMLSIAVHIREGGGV